jgi:osmotically inducible lipoprotein OsmB
MRVSIVLALGAALLLAACGQTPTDRALTGAGFGAAGGALLGSVIGAPMIGALAGGAVGATAGAATDPSEIYLGQPVWK